MKRMMKSLLAGLLCCALILGLGSASAASAATHSDYKTVRVGWYHSPMFQDGVSDDAVKSGYCYDYLQKVADYTAWKYEYVYGSWTELFAKLERGEIDLLGGVSLTEERSQTMLFPDYAMGTDQYYLFKRSDDREVSQSNLSSLNGKILGGIHNNRMTVMAKQWLEENHLDMKLVYFHDFAQQEDALRNGEIDLMVQTINNVLNMDDIDVVSKVGEGPFYLAVSRQQKGLLAELNDSLTRIISIDPFVLQNLQYKNYGANLVNKTLSDAEMDWVASHNTVIVGYLDNYLPYSATGKDGRATGILTDVFSAILGSLGLEESLVPEYRGFQNYREMVNALRQGEIHTAFPVYGNLWDLERDGINASAEVVSTSESFFYLGTYAKGNVKSIAVNRNNDMQQAYCRRVFPEADVRYGDTIEDCLDMVLSGKADGTVINTLRTELVTRNSKYDSLTYVQLDADDSRCFGVNEGNVELLTMLNRGLRVIGPVYGIDNAYKYMESFFKYGVTDFLRDNILLITLIVGSVVLAVIGLLAVGLKQKARQVRQANEFNQRIKSLKDKADKANAAKTLFLNNMSHDIRTPMNAIIGYTEIAQKQVISSEVKSCLEKIRDSSEHLLSLINDVLDISRIESGTVTLSPEPSDMSEITNGALNIVNGYLTGRRLNFQVERHLNVLPFAMADGLKIREILVNLLGNAVKFTDDGGTIRFGFELNAGEPGQVLVRYTVADTGRGMSEEFQQHIFEEFSQENKGPRTQYKGTGLGLPITKTYVEMMNGTISFESTQGVGTTFTVELPLPAADPVLSAEKIRRPADLHSVRGLQVLLAEDNNLNAEIAQIQLDEAGIRVTRVTDGSKAVEMFQNSPPGAFDLILMDIMMPNMDGYQAARAIRAMEHRPDGGQIPIIAMTANAFSEDIRKSFDAGMNAHLTKPVKAEELLQTIAQTVEDNKNPVQRSLHAKPAEGKIL